MHKFPVIETIDDVLPAIEGRDEFIVADKGDYIVINYNVGFEDTFPPLRVAGGSRRMREERMLHYALRRECRGIIFYPDGTLMSRPFHKFFNINEREETLIRNIDMSRPHRIMEKMDGSMIRPLLLGENRNDLRLGTKMGITDTSLAAEKIVTGDQIATFRANLMRGVTLLTEFTSPDNRIVIAYDEPELVLLAARENRTGDYLPYEELLKLDAFTIVPQYGSVDGSLEEYVAREREREGREGFILSFPNEMHKGKNDWYVRIHKVKDQIRTDRHILALLLHGQLDDVYPHLDERDYKRVKLYSSSFYWTFKEKARELTSDVGVVCGMAKDKKDLATNIMPKSTLKGFGTQVAFRVYDRQQEDPTFDVAEYVGDELMQWIHNHLGSTVKYEEMSKYIGLPDSLTILKVEEIEAEKRGTED